jgi:glycosyltransferase involved in cell wall biosynthesis
MRVLMLTELYPPFIGGSEEYVRNLARGLVERGHQVSVATMAADNAPSTTDEDGVTVHRVRSSVGRLSALQPSGRPYHAPAPDPDVTLALRQIVRDERPDVVHAHNWMVSSFLPLKETSDAALVMTLHDYSLVCAKRSLLWHGRECSGAGFSKCLHCAANNYGTARGELITLGAWASAPLVRRTVDFFVPVSRAVAARNELVNADDVAYEVTPNFVPDDVVSTANPTHPALVDLPAEGFWLYVGALSRHKGVRSLLDAYAGVGGAPPLVIVGRQSPDAPVELPAGATLITDLPHDAVMAAWQRATLGVVPSIFPDPCPTVVLEAMAAGVPVVGSHNGGMSDLVADGQTGLLVPPGDALAMREALCRVLGDEKGRKKMARAAAKRAPQFMASAVIPRIESVYSRVVG